MSKEIRFEIILDGKSVPFCNSIVLHQSFNAHHTFEVVLDQDVLGKLASHDLYDYQDYVGRDLYIGFGENDPHDNEFNGIVTEVGLQQGEGAWGKLILKGKSRTCLLDAGANYSSYEKMGLIDIVHQCVENTTSSQLNLKIKPFHKEEINYMCQYGENSFDFINRLSAEYGEWFFYDGSDLCFGRPSKQQNIELVYGSNISAMSYAMQILPSNTDVYSYKSADDNIIMASLPSVDTTSSLTKTALKRSSELYRKPVKQPAAIRINDQSQMDAHVKVQKGKHAATTMLLKATGDSPKVLLGNNVTIKLSKAAPKKGYDDHGEYLVTKVSHFLTGTGSYKNTMEAIPSANEIIPFTAPKPIAQTQMAVVLDNNDPKGMGRVRVQMLWQQDTNQKTGWIRVMTPDAGGTGEVSKNRGHVFIPEEGDQVLIGFRYSDPSRPFVLGSLFHGSTAAGGKDKNSIKSIQTRSGHMIEFNDTSGSESITITDKNKNIIILDTNASSITISAPENISIKAKNIDLTAKQNISLSAGTDISFSAKENITSIAGENIIEQASKDATLTANNIIVNAQEKISRNAKNISDTAEEIVANSSKKDMMLSSGKKVNMQSGEKVKLF
ncbi:phage baseplate assembly protein V [uncultured Cytophaga sp.]|uniref:type VI secretion system Vgr family protein n=1 Tax=uncultured Cytophaga sp. TaxID=160238 RepID=UPI002610DE79|nr:phage baseplate assembly protein V [uncultured Cytophaga sp.]